MAEHQRAELCLSLLSSSRSCSGSSAELLTWWKRLSSWQGWSSMSIASHPLSGTPLQNLSKQALPCVACGSTNYAKPKLHSAALMTLHCIMLIAVSSASQFAGVIHWISLVILSVFFSEVCITKSFTTYTTAKHFYVVTGMSKSFTVVWKQIM